MSAQIIKQLDALGSKSVLEGLFKSVLLIFSVLVRNLSARRFGVSKTVSQDGSEPISEKRLANFVNKISDKQRQQDGLTLLPSKKGHIYMRAYTRICGAEFFPKSRKSVLLMLIPSFGTTFGADR